ncbi:Rtr1/RPAP2 family-domain-containing protein [Bisporella sp. PMI_857]|nr:Rtr1/RPAP2 family-domain-containing protein [Bisporella sp. PMI_857]
MATSNMPKSILKKTAYPATASRASGTMTKAERDRETALYHAHLIQQRKDTELEIFASMEELMEYPLALPPYDASNPSPVDAKNLKAYLRPYQPSDYDALIVERNINDRCGFALCRNKNAKDGKGGKYRILGRNSKDFRVVETAETEKWCSQACAKRALYVRVQLSEVPAWERNGFGEVDIDLLDEPKTADDIITDKFGEMDIDDDGAENKRQAGAVLALERGEKKSDSRNRLVAVSIRENVVEGPVQPPSFDTGGLSDQMDALHLTLEGHISRFDARNATGDRRNSDEDTDWKL